MEIKEAYVTNENLTNMYRIIEDTLLKNPNTQVFIDNEIYQTLSANGGHYDVFSPNMSKTWHYRVDNDNFGGEEWLNLTKGIAFDYTIFAASFISNCKDYMQLVEFRSSKIERYIHFLVGFENLLLIHYEK